MKLPSVWFQLLYAALMVAGAILIASTKSSWLDLGAMLAGGIALWAERRDAKGTAVQGEALVIEEITRRIQAMELAIYRLKAGVDE